ncbi:MAG TPA: MFS transporter [Spirochaetota bacterium]|nr:MFS transporter [Spirochaetota bacterium]
MNEQQTGKKPIGRNVTLMGLTSFFTDISSEMIYPLIQAFVSAVMASSKTMVGPVLGVIEGIAEATASLLKVYSGYISDRFQSRKPLTIAGYSLSALSKLLYLAAGLGWSFILLARFADRVGKGVRTAPRDALIADSVDPSIKGRAYGFHRAMDYSGALIGVAVCYFLSLAYLDPVTKTITDLDAFYMLFLISLVPAFIGVVMLFLVREKRADHQSGERPTVSFSLAGMDHRLKIFFLAVFIFTLGNSSNQFLLLKTMDAGVGLPDMLLMYMVFNLTTSVLSTPLGSLSDRAGRTKIILAGYALYSAIYLAFGFIGGETKGYLWAFWALYGVYYALTEGVEKALVADLAPAERRGTVMGLFATIVGVALLPASVIAGLLYAYAGTAWPFMFGGAMSAVAFIIILVGLRDKN